jgi:quinoprotein glucose dehydrogenase
MEYQYIPDRGPFNREKIWHPFHAEQPAFIVPPVENVADGPSGLIYYPGTGLGDQLTDMFLLADFRGTPNQSGIRAIRVEPHGAHFKLVSNEKLVWNILATDLALGTDGSLYISDWVDGWDGTGKGRLYRFANQRLAAANRPVDMLLRGDWSKQDVGSLKNLLTHKDQRVRQAAQFELVSRNELIALLQVAGDANMETLARVHAIWGLGQISRFHAWDNRKALDPLAKLLADGSLQVRAAACLVLGENRYQPAADRLTQLIADSEPRVAHYAANAVAKLSQRSAFQPAVDLLKRANNDDPVLRHAAVLVLASSAENDGQLEALARHESAAVRIGAVVALRRRQSAYLQAFINDKDKLVQAEAIRAIHDLPVSDAYPAIAKLLTREELDPESTFRSLNANYRIGGPEQALEVAGFAARKTAPEKLRVEAIKMLASWAKPDERDRYLNFWRPVDVRSADEAKSALKNVVLSLLDGSSDVRYEAIQAAVKYQANEIVEPLVKLLADDSTKTRSMALRAIAQLDQQRTKGLIEPFLTDKDWEVSTAALDVLSTLDPARAATFLSGAVQSQYVGGRQAAWKLAGELSQFPESRAVLESGVKSYIDGKLPDEDWLDMLKAASGKVSEETQQRLADQQAKWVEENPIAQWRWALAGGDVDRGNNIFQYKTEVSCLRCHKVGSKGGEVGPALTDLGAKKDAQYLLEAIVLPSNKIAEGFETVTMLDDIGTVHTGVLKQETDEFVEYMTAEGKLVRVEKDAIEERRKGNSAMPAEIVKQLSQDELRDLVAYLTSLKGQSKKEDGH